MSKFTAKVAEPLNSKVSGLWGVEIDVLMEGHVHSSVRSECLFETVEDALQAGARAVFQFNETGRFPSMNKPF